MSFLKPSLRVLRRFVDSQSKLPFSYKSVGATAAAPPAGYVVDLTRIKLGNGETIYQAAVMALKHWKQFDLGWVESWPHDAPIRAGETVAVMGRALGLWWLNACRIVYVVDESGPTSRFGFAYGTLPAHAESGEERFLIEQDAAGAVWYDILAFSRPNTFLARLGYPFVRRLQKRFARDSAAAMLKAVQAGY
jgi:uncharacterized protein (UPF0548 family)